MMDWHLLSKEEALEKIKSNGITGLSSSEAADRLASYGPNELMERGGRTPLQILWEQITAVMVLILVSAAVVAAILGDTKNAVAILAIIILYASLGFIQEYRAEKAIASLKRLAVPNVRVLRDGKLMETSARLLVPGDILKIETGNVIPADARILESINLRVQESALTGESEAVEKRVDAVSGADLALGDRRNMAYMGTVVTQGRGSALVVASGMKTELGKIADLLQKKGHEQTLLQRRLDRLGKVLAIVGLVIASFVFALGLWQGDDIKHMLLTAVSVAVAIVPEGLPAVVTITLALGAQRMLRRNALIRTLPAVETLGSVTVICSDKTGTLTENRMTVMVLDVVDHVLDLTEVAKGNTILTERASGKPITTPLSLLVAGGALCNDAQLISDSGDHYHTVGDPTEGAMVAAAARLGYWKGDLDIAFPRVAELPFDSDRKRMTTFHTITGQVKEILNEETWDEGHVIAFTKGSVDGLLECSTHVWMNGQIVGMDGNWRQRIETANNRLANKGMRVLGVAFREFEKQPVNISLEDETGLVFVGLFGMIDPPRPEVRQAVEMTRNAGIRTVMITGDHPITAAEIARQLGILDDGKVLIGSDVEKMSMEELKAAAESVRVYARVSPEHKLKIVQALQENGHIVSMTGDGVNDAPALRKADIGVAMGITGTDVSKEAADLVLLDDNFSTIVAAVQEGRTIYDNIRKFVRFSVAGNFGKVMVMVLAPFLGKPIPLLPMQLLWLNLLTDGLLGLGLGVESPEAGTMNRQPYSPREGVFSRGAARQTIWTGLLIGGLALGIGAWYYFGGRENWQTMVFTSLAFAQIGQALAGRSSQDSLFRTGLRSNPLMLGMAVLVSLLQLSVVYLPPLQDFFSTQPLLFFDLLIAISCGLILLFAIEMEKFLSKPKVTKLR